MTKSRTVNQLAGLRALSQDEIAAVTGGAVSYTASFGGLGCFPIFEDDGRGGVITISPTLGRLGRIFPR